MKLFLQLFIYVLIGFICLSCNTPTNNESDNPLSLELSILDFSGKQVTEFSKSDTVSFLLTVQNKTNDTIKVTYMTSQEYNFYIKKNNEVIWNWSYNKVFNQVIINDAITPNEKKEFIEKWPDEQVQDIKVGDYILVGEHLDTATYDYKKLLNFSIVD